MASPAASRPRAAPPLISRVPYLPGLDGMRALAVVAVMVYHANPSWLHGGFLGVEVFFIISGYLITLLLVAEEEKTERVSLKQFWLRRARRLLPALYTMMTLVIVYTWLFERDQLGKLRGDVIAGLLYVSNWYQIWTGAGYTAGNEFAPLRHLWSLAVEEQFYLFWPLVMLAFLGMGRRNLPQVGLWLIGASVAITGVVALLYHSGPIGECTVTPQAYFHGADRCFSKMDVLYLSTPTRMGGILLGAGMAMWWRPYALMRSPMKNKGHLLDIAALIGLAVLALVMWNASVVETVVDQGQVAGRLLFQGGFLITGLATVAVIAAVTHRGAFAGRLLGNPVFLWVGTRSYGLYLYHWPIYQAIRKEAGIELTLPEFALAMALTVAITEASYRFIETPIRKGHLSTAFRGLFASTPQAAVRRRRVLVTSIAAIVLPIVAGVQLATAQLKQDEVAENIKENQGAVTDISDILGNDTVPDTTAPQTASTDGNGNGNGTEAPATTDAGGTGNPNGGSRPGTTKPGATTKPPRSTTTTTTKPQKGKIDVYALGDSVMLGAANELSERGAIVDAEVNRQGTTGADMLEQLDAAGVLGNVVVIHLGTNGPASQTTYDRMLAATDSVPLVLMLTIRADRSWTEGNNAIIRSLPGSHPNVRVLDWASLSNSCPGDCYYEDNIHLKPDGQKYYTDLIWQAIGRA